MAGSITQIAKQADVSVSLVSRYLNQDPSLRITPDRRKRIEAAQKRLGGVRRRRVARRARNFVAPVNRIFSPHWLQDMANTVRIQKLETALGQMGFRLSFSLFDQEQKLDQITQIIESTAYCDGLLLMTGVGNEDLARLLVDRQIPHISIDPAAESLGINTVVRHLSGALHQAITHLKDLGHRRIAFMGRKTPFYWTFMAAMSTAQLPTDGASFCPITLRQEEWDTDCHETARAQFGTWLDGGATATAIVCFCDAAAYGAIQAMQDRGLEPGRDISVIGSDDFESQGQYFLGQPFLTAFNNADEQIGMRCGELLLNQVLHDQRQIIHERIPLKLTLRQSTGPCRSGV